MSEQVTVVAEGARQAAKVDSAPHEFDFTHLQSGQCRSRRSVPKGRAGI